MSKNKANQVNVTVDKEAIDSLFKILVTLRGGVAPEAAQKKGKRNNSKVRDGNPIEDPTDISELITNLFKALTDITTAVVELKEHHNGDDDSGSVKELQKQVRIQEDEIDECRQRSMKGNFILTSPDIPASSKKNVIKSDEQLRGDGGSLTSHILQLVKEKYDVAVPENDIQALHRLPNGTVILRLWNRRPGSAWTKIVDGIKSGMNKHINFYANFHLTRKRNGILYEVRQLKKSGQIFKFYTDENGQISFRVKDKSEKVKVTYVTKKRDDIPKTLTKEEILQIVSQS